MFPDVFLIILLYIYCLVFSGGAAGTSKMFLEWENDLEMKSKYLDKKVCFWMNLLFCVIVANDFNDFCFFILDKDCFL